MMDHNINTLKAIKGIVDGKQRGLYEVGTYL